MTPLEAHLACAALVAADLGARTLRLRWLVGGAGYRLSAGEAFRTNVFADAGATLTPMRLGGEPARIASLRLARVPFHAIGVALGYEILTSWGTLLLAAVLLAWWFAPEWLADAGPRLLATINRHELAIVAVIAASALAVLAAHRLRHRWQERLASPIGEAVRCWRSMPPRPVAMSVGCSAVNIVSRTALLPILALSLPDPPQAATLWLGSFLLVYGQLFLPTPAGAGAVEFGLLGGMAGDLGGGAGLLVAWRWWSSGASTVLGVMALTRVRRRHLTAP